MQKNHHKRDMGPVPRYCHIFLSDQIDLFQEMPDVEKHKEQRNKQKTKANKQTNQNNFIITCESYIL